MSTTPKERISRDLAHALKNPLGAILGYSEALLETKLVEGLSEKQRSVIFKIQLAARELLSTLEGVEDRPDRKPA